MEEEVKDRKITVELLTSGQAFKRGRNFSEEDFLPTPAVRQFLRSGTIVNCPRGQLAALQFFVSP